MPRPAKGLYAPRLVDITFALMGFGSAALLFKGGTLSIPPATSTAAEPYSGLAVFALVVLVALSACLAHKIDRQGWDDYMAQIVAQSALIGMVTVLLAGVAFDFLLVPWLGLAAPGLMIQGMVPIACLAWAIGYGFLRWKGTGA